MIDDSWRYARPSTRPLPGQTALFLITLLAVGVAGGFAFFWRLGASSITHIDESTHAVVTREMRESGDWLNLTIRGVPYNRKPPLAFWIRGAVQNAFGENELTNRLPSALAGLGTLLLVALWAWQWTRRISVVIASSFVFLLIPMHFVHTFRNGEADGLLIFFSTLSAYLFWQSTRHPRLIISAIFAVGLTFMIKSAAAAVIPATFLVALFFVQTWPYRWRDIGIGIALFLALVLPWHIQQLIAHGRSFWNEYFGFHILERVTKRLHTSPQRHGFFWYLTDMKRYFFPWVWLLPAALAFSWRRIYRSGAEITEAFLLTWGVGTVALYTLASTKLEWYIAPAFPAFALLLGRFVVEPFVELPRWLRWVAAAGYVGFLAQAIPQFRTGAAGWLTFAWLPSLVTFGLILGVMVVLIGIAYWRGQQRGERMMIALTIVALLQMTLLASAVFSRRIRHVEENSFRAFRNAIVQKNERTSIFVFEKPMYSNPLTPYYLEGERHARTVTPLREDRAALRQALQTSPGAFVILRTGTVAQDELPFLRQTTVFGEFTLYEIVTPPPPAQPTSTSTTRTKSSSR